MVKTPDLRTSEDILKILRAEGIRPDPDASFKVTRIVRGSGVRIAVRISLWDPAKPAFINKQINDPTVEDIVVAYCDLLSIPSPYKKRIELPPEPKPKHVPPVKPEKPKSAFPQTERIGALRNSLINLPRRVARDNFWERAYIIKTRLNLENWEKKLGSK